MNEHELLENIKEKSISELNGLSDAQYRELLNASIRVIDKTLDAGDTIEIDDFGVFSRRKHNAVSVSFFRPAERLNDRINRKK
ncbi:MAG: HU family DNA-binding protein [Prevotella sp.]|jgi:nucleoid DNA-binding protein|nr:HU family DNA-binding protein [Prevotella sp.]